MFQLLRALALQYIGITMQWSVSRVRYEEQKRWRRRSVTIQLLYCSVLLYLRPSIHS